MEYRNLEITLVSADGLKDINMVGKMDLYAVAYLAGNPAAKQKTGVDKNCGTKPRWNKRLKFTLDEHFLASPPGGGLCLVVRIMAEKYGSDKDVGEVTVNISELFKDGVEVEKKADYKIGGRGKGVLNISYKFGEKFSQDDVKSKNVDQPVLAYPQGMAPQGAYPMDKGYGMGEAPPPQQGYAPYPPQSQAPVGYPSAGYPPAGGYPAYGAPSGNPGYGAPPAQGYYGAPPPQGYYGAPPPQGGYGPPPPQQYGGYSQHPKPHKKKKSGMGGMGMGMGMGLGAGLLGGMLLGDMMGDVGEAAAYADGYGDAMGDSFDF